MSGRRENNLAGNRDIHSPQSARGFVMRRLFAVMTVVMLLLAGTMSAGATLRSGTSTTNGVTPKEIKLGVTYVDLESIRSQINLDIGNFPKMYTAILDDLNAKGGINGRKVVPAFAPINPLGTTPSQEACVKLVEDEKVFAVTGFFLGDAPLCYVEQYTTPVVGGTQSAEELARAKAPWFTLEPGDHVAAQAVDALVADGAFKGGKLGIIISNDAKSLYDDVVAPALKQHKVSGTVASITASQGDSVAIERESATILERFKSEGVNKILVVGQDMLGVGNALSKTDYRPRLLVLSETFLRSYVVNPGSNLDVVKNAIAANVNVDFNEPGLQECFKIITKATGYQMFDTVPTGQPDYAQGAEIACRASALFAGLAKAAGKKLTTASFAKAAEKAGPIEIPGSGKVTYDKKTHTFEQPVYIYRFDPATKTTVRDQEPSA
jgi:ABC-type branched-subunit amino acid transport system substrate-binding protein